MLVPVHVMAVGEEPSQDDKAAKHELWFREIRQKKHEFLVKELDLTADQQEPFFRIYDSMDEELRSINDQTRRLERAVSRNADAAESEYDAAIDAVYSQRYREGLVENEYKERLGQILTKKQMLRLKRAEFKFTRALMKHHREARDRKPR